jgi:MscS family membrane protein
MSNKRKNSIVKGLILAALIVAICAAFLGAAARAAEEATETTAEGKATLPEIDLEKHLELPAWARVEIIGIAVWQFITAFIAVLLGLILKKVSDFVLENKVIPLTEKTPFALDTLVAKAASKPLGYVFVIAGLAVAFAVLPLPETPDVSKFVFGTLKVLLAADVVWFLFRAVDVGVYYVGKLAERTDSRLDDQLIPLLRKALKVTIGLIAFVSIVEFLGGNVASLLAGLGIGGLAVALALQDTLANFFGSILIFLDRPFTVGDWVKLSDVEGTVEEIGFRSTRIRTWPATLVSIPNKTVANSTIDNCSKMPKRRVYQTVGVTYETTADQMDQAVRAIREIVKNDSGVDTEFIVISFTDFGDSSLNILVYYFTKDIAFADHVATKERINLAIMHKLDEMGLSIAFPTRTLYLEGEVAERLAGRIGDSDTSNG